jgi:hypothetical protein
MSHSFVAIVGAPMELQTIYGTFECFEDADDWCATHFPDSYTWILTLHSPKEVENDS